MAEVRTEEGLERLHAKPDRRYDALHYDLELSIQGRDPVLHAGVKMEFRVSQPTRKLVLDAEEMDIHRVAASFSVHDWSHRNGELVIESDQVLAAGFEGDVRVLYSVKQPTAGFYFVLPQESDLEIVPAQVFTQGECNDARFWFPCNDHPSDRATHSVTARIPTHWRAMAAGKKVGSQAISATMKRVAWRLDRPMPPYLFTFVAGEFEYAEESGGGTQLQFLYEPLDSDLAREAFSRSGNILNFMSRATEFPYPFEKYAQSVVREFPYGAMENVSATTCGRKVLLRDQEFQPAWQTVAHEAAHQWFGDIVTCSSWPHAWLNEGFATYYALLYRRHALGEKDFNWHMGATLDRYLNACTGEKKRALIKHLYNDPLELFFDGTIYPGGASRLHLMRGWWGDALFEAAIQSYVREHAWQSVDTSALEQAFVAQGARDASMVFQQWVEAPGYPEVHLSWEWIQGELRIQVRQTHESSNSPSIGGHRRGTPWAFHFPLDIQWKNGRGVVQQERVWVRERESTFALAEPQAVAWVSFDPEVFVPARWVVEEDETFTRARMLEAPSVRDRSLALQQLVAHRSRASEGLGAADEAALWSVALDEGAHPRLRGQALEALGKVQAAVIKGSLGGGAKSVEAWLREPAPVAMAWLEAILKLQRDPRVRAVEDSVLADSTLHLRYRELVLQAQGERTLDGWLNERSSKSFEPSPR